MYVIKDGDYYWNGFEDGEDLWGDELQHAFAFRTCDRADQVIAEIDLRWESSGLASVKVEDELTLEDDSLPADRPTPARQPDSQLFSLLRSERGEIQVRMGDLTKEPVDAIVNPANERLQHGGGAAGAISKAAGPELQVVSNNHVAVYGPVHTGGRALRTLAYRLPCRWIIHTVGPIAQKVPQGVLTENGEPLRVMEDDCDLLYSAALNALREADLAGCTTVSMPAISSGIFGFPKDICATLLFEAAQSFLEGEAAHVRVVRFTNFDRQTVEVFIAESERRANAQSNGDQEA